MRLRSRARSTSYALLPGRGPASGCLLLRRSSVLYRPGRPARVRPIRLSSRRARSAVATRNLAVRASGRPRRTVGHRTIHEGRWYVAGTGRHRRAVARTGLEERVRVMGDARRAGRAAALVAGGRAGRDGHGRRHLAQRAAAGRGHACWSGPTARRSAASPAAASRARSTSCAARSIDTGGPVLQRYGVSDDDAFDGRPDLRRHHRRVRRAGRPGRRFPELGDGGRVDRGGRAGRGGDRASAGRPDRLGRRLVIWPDRPRRAPSAGPARRRGRPTTPAACSPAAGPACCTTGPTASGAATA